MTGGQMNTVKLELFGQDPRILKAISVARSISVSKAPVLLVGEVGIGKRSLGKFIHEYSNRSSKPLEIVDCSKDPQNVENTILGFRDEETGRFTRGVLENGNGGTVIFANVDGLEGGFQKRLHRILTELGDYDIDIRIIATTTKNLTKLVGVAKFYRGLYTFIGSNVINLPSLRERIGDLEMLARHYIRHYADEQGKNVNIDKSAMDKVMGHYWTHNIYELKAVIENSLGNLEGDILTEQNLIIGGKKGASMILEDDNEGIRLMSLKEAEKLLIKKALIHTSENRTQAAKILGVSIRTLRNKINEYRNSGSIYFVNLR